MRWVGLVRVSSIDQAGGALTQREAIEAWVTGRGDELMTIFADEGIPGTLEYLNRREGWGKALAALIADEADGVLVGKLDRLARDVILQEQMIGEIHRAGGMVMSAHPGEGDLLGPGVNEPTRKLVRQVLGAVSEFERTQIKYRAKAGYERAKAAGVWMGGRPPYGWKRIGKGQLIVDEREQQVIGESLVLREDFKLTYAAIGEFFVASGMPPKGLSTRRHADTTVRTILANARRKGIQRRSLSALARQFVGIRPDERSLKYDHRRDSDGIIGSR